MGGITWSGQLEAGTVPTEMANQIRDLAYSGSSTRRYLAPSPISEVGATVVGARYRRVRYCPDDEGACPYRSER